MLEELDLSGDSFISRKSLMVLSEACQQISVFHLGHFEHSDYDCERTVLKSKDQQPLRGIFIVELFKKEYRFANLKKLVLEFQCELTHYIRRMFLK